MIYDPQKMFEELERAAEARAEAEYQAHLLEKNGEILIGQIMKETDAPATVKKEYARTDPRWKVHVEGEAEAIRQRSRARAHYANLQALADARKTQEVSARALTR